MMKIYKRSHERESSMESIPYPFMEDKELEKEYSMTSDNTEQTQKRI